MSHTRRRLCFSEGLDNSRGALLLVPLISSLFGNVLLRLLLIIIIHNRPRLWNRIGSRFWRCPRECGEEKESGGPKIIIALDFNQTVFRLGDAETETVIFSLDPVIHGVTN